MGRLTAEQVLSADTSTAELVTTVKPATVASASISEMTSEPASAIQLITAKSAHSS